MRTGTLILATALTFAGCSADDPTPKPSAATSSAAPGSQATPTTKPATKTPPKPARAARRAKQAPFRAPVITRALPAAHTVAVIGLEGLDWAFRGLGQLKKGVAPMLADKLDGPLAKDFASPAWPTQYFGFPPNTPSGWQNVGIQPAAGLSVVLDARLFESFGPVPLIYMQTSHRGKVLNWLSQLDRKFGDGDGVKLTGEKQGRCELLAWGPRRACLADRRGFVAVMPLPQGRAESHPALMKAFDAVIADAGPSLADLPRFQQAVAAWQGGPGVFAYADHKTLAKASITLGVELNSELQFYLDRFPATGLVLSKRGSGLRLLADPAGAAALRQILVPHGKAPDFARLWHPQATAVGTTLNLETLFDGVLALVPPSRDDLKGKVLLGKNMAPPMIGLTFAELAATFTGHALLIGRPEPNNTAELYRQMMMAVGVGPQAEANLVKLLDNAKHKIGTLAYTRRTVQGRPAFAIEGGPLAVIDGDLLLVGEPALVEAALKRQGQGPSVLATSHLLSVAMDLSLFDSTIPGADAAALKAMWTQLLGSNRFESGFVVDDLGLRADGPGIAVLLGVVNAIAIPGFVKYIKRAKSAQAEFEVRALGDAAEVAWILNGPPKSVPLTPADDPCREGHAHYFATGDTFAAFAPIKFQPAKDSKHYYRYSLEVSSTGFTARAVGDLDCDGVYSTFERQGTLIDGQAKAGAITQTNPLE